MTDSLRLRDAIAVVVTTGLLFGLNIGYAGVAMQFTRDISECAQYTGPAECSAVPAACTWFSGECRYNDQPVGAPTCLSNLTESRCFDVAHCFFVDGVCVHDLPWTANERGLFASVSVVGSFLGSLVSGPLLRTVHQRHHCGLLATTGLISLVAVALLTVGWFTPSDGTRISTLPILVAGRVVSGFAIGVAMVLAPLYAAEISPSQNREVVILTLIISISVGTLLMVLAGYALDTNMEHARLRVGMAVIHALIALVSVAQVIVPFTVFHEMPDMAAAESPPQKRAEPSSPSTPLLTPEHREALAKAERDGACETPVESDPNNIPVTSLWKCVVAGIVLALGQQFSGIDIIMNFAPTISVNMGLTPFAGAAVIALWNVVASTLCLWLQHHGVTISAMNRWGLAVASLGSFMSAVSLSPRVFQSPDNPFPAILLTVSLLTSITAFEMALAPSFYLLAQRIFPRDLRTMGSSAVMALMFFTNFMLSWWYPWMVETLAAGTGGQLRSGKSYVFLFLSVVSLLCALGSYALMRHVR